MNLLAHRTAPTPVIDFATASKPALAELIANLIATKNAAEAACAAQGRAEEAFGFGHKKSPQVLGGMTEPMTMTRGKLVSELPASEWFYSSRESIDKDHASALETATTDAARDEVEKRFAGLLAEYDRQEKASQRSYPRQLRAAERAADRALKIWTAAEQALVHYRPGSIAEAAELLALAGRPQKSGTVNLDIDEASLKVIASNCAVRIQNDLAH